MQLTPHPKTGPVESPTQTKTTGLNTWSLRAVAGAVMLTSALGSSGAWALALGRINVQSYLGQPLRAEVDLPSLTAAEAASLRAAIASPEAFRAASMEYNGVLSDVRLQLEQRADGRSVLRLTSTRPINEPFMDVVLDVNWANGHMVRGYTMLLDPIGTPAVKPVQAQPTVTTQTATPPTSSKPPKTTPAKEASPPPVAAAPTAAATPDTEPAKDAVGSLKIAKGATAYGIAKTYKPEGVTLEQMLVGMLRANPNAFVGSNVNRMKAGAVLDLPTPSAIQEVAPADAQRMIAAQSQDFNAYRRRLAEVAPQSQAGTMNTSDRSATGSVQAEVTEPAPATPAPDKLTLSKGSVKATAADESKIATERQKAEAEARQQEINRNLEELKKLSTVAEGTAPAAPETTAPPVEPAAEASAAPEPAPQATTPPPTPALPQPPAPPAAAPAGPGFAEQLRDTLSGPLLAPVAGGVAAIAGLLVLLRLRRKRKDGSESEFSELELPAVATNGAVTDTTASQSISGVSSMMYSPSQLDAGGDVDPIAEADVYLAYGRDKQAEEILIEALRLHPERVNIHTKLLEIYAQRRDVMAFAGTATEVFKLTEGQGPDWEQTCTLGQGLDPNNPLYASSGEGSVVSPIIPPPVELELGGQEPAEPVSELSDASGESSDFDLELPLDSGLETASPDESGAPSGMDFDLDIESPAPQAPEPEAAPVAAAEPATDLGLDFDFDLGAPEPEPAPAPTMPPEFDGLSLDLDDMEAEQVADADLLPELPDDAGTDSADPLETKLSLAQEFEAIGDTEGARSLAEEVVAEATGSLQARAQAFLAQLP